MGQQKTKFSLLIADDQEDVCDVIRMCIESIDSIGEVYTALDGALAEEMIRKHKPNVVLLDIQMPKKDGINVIESVLKDKIISPNQIIILSGQLHSDRLKAAAKLGINSIMPKPFKQDALIQKIQSVLHAQGDNIQEDDSGF